MRIPIFLITNIIWLIGICNSASKPEKIARNFHSKQNSDGEYITVDISSNSPVDQFYFVNTQINNVDTTIFFPNFRYKIGEIVDKNYVLWTQSQREQFLVGFISTKKGSSTHIINLMINSPFGVEKILYHYNKDGYSRVDIFKFLDIFQLLRQDVFDTSFVLDLEKEEIPQIVDKNIILGPYRGSLMVPKAGFIANRIIFGELEIYDGSHMDMNVPVAIGYEIDGNSYLDIIEVQYGSVVGHIYTYKITGYRSTLVSSSEHSSIFDIFAARFTQPPAAPELNLNKLDFLPVVEPAKEINFDIKNIDPSLVRIDQFTVLNICTTKYTPVKCLITSVSYGKKQIWAKNNEETACYSVIVHSFNDQIQTIELSTLLNGKIVIKKIPFSEIDDHQPADFNFAEMDRKLSASSSGNAQPSTSKSKSGVEKIVLPPNSPVFSPPNSPARTPPPSPMRSPSNSICSDDKIVVNKVQDDDDEYEYDEEDDMYYHNFDPADGSKFSTIDPPPYTPAAVADAEVKLVNSNGVSTLKTPFANPDYVRSLIQQENYNSQYEKHYSPVASSNPFTADGDLILDISTPEERSKVLVIDGTFFVPFLFLIPHPHQTIKALVDGEQKILDVTETDQLIKYVTLYLERGAPTAIYCILLQQRTVINKFFVKKEGKWAEVDIHEYTKKTPYSFSNLSVPKQIPAPVKPVDSPEDKPLKERVLHVSIMVPVILGSLFLVISICSLLFILFFC